MENKIEKGIQLLYDRLQWMTENNIIKETSLPFYNNIIEMITQGSNEAETYIEHLEKENARLTRKIILTEHHYEHHKTCLEAICLCHGIYDINSWLLKSERYLIAEAKRCDIEQTFYLPYNFLKLKNLINEAISRQKDHQGEKS